MISVTFFCTRNENLKEIIDRYNSYSFVDEILVVHLNPINEIITSNKTKFIYMSKQSDLGLLSRYTFALSCKNRFVFIQDDDHVFDEEKIKEMYNLQPPITGCHPRWFFDNEYKSKAKGMPKKGTAPIILTVGCLVDTHYLPGVISYAKDFFKDYQKVFNGEDIFMSRAIAKLSNQSEFPFLKKGYKTLSTKNALSKNVNSKQDRTDITRRIYEYFK